MTNIFQIIFILCKLIQVNHILNVKYFSRIVKAIKNVFRYYATDVSINPS